MGLLDKVIKKKAEDGGGRMAEIWRIEDASDFVIALQDYIEEKCRYGDDMSALSRPERIFYITQTLEAEINNGGFSQFFCNSGGTFANELVGAFSEIGAARTAEICQRAIAAFGRDIPVDRAAREAMLEAAEGGVLDGILEECDDAFYEYADDLDALNYEYALKNRDLFI